MPWRLGFATDRLVIAHGFETRMLAGLVHEGLATATSRRASEGWRRDGRGRPFHDHDRRPAGDRRLIRRSVIDRLRAPRSIIPTPDQFESSTSQKRGNPIVGTSSRRVQTDWETV